MSSVLNNSTRILSNVLLGVWVTRFTHEREVEKTHSANVGECLLNRIVYHAPLIGYTAVYVTIAYSIFSSLPSKTGTNIFCVRPVAGRCTCTNAIICGYRVVSVGVFHIVLCNTLCLNRPRMSSRLMTQNTTRRYSTGGISLVRESAVSIAQCCRVKTTGRKY